MIWNEMMMQQARDYGFLGPIVGISGLLLSAATALLFGFTRTVKIFQPPPDMLVAALMRVVTLLCAVGLFVAWFQAEPNNGRQYLRFSIWLAVICVIAFLIYVGLRAYCGRFRKPTILANNQAGPDEVIWGGFWLTPRAWKAVQTGETVEAFLAGNNYRLQEVWPPLSRTLAAVLAALLLLTVLVAGTAALTTVSAATQVVLTKKPARAVISSDEVPGLPSAKEPSPSPNP